MPMLSEQANELVKFGFAIIFGFGIMFFVGTTFLSALPAGSLAYNSVNNVILSFGNGVSQILVPIVLIIFVLFLYVVAKHYGLVE